MERSIPVARRSDESGQLRLVGRVINIERGDRGLVRASSGTEFLRIKASSATTSLPRASDPISLVSARACHSSREAARRAAGGARGRERLQLRGPRGRRSAAIFRAARPRFSPRARARFSRTAAFRGRRGRNRVRRSRPYGEATTARKRRRAGKFERGSREPSRRHRQRVARKDEKGRRGKRARCRESEGDAIQTRGRRVVVGGGGGGGGGRGREARRRLVEKMDGYSPRRAEGNETDGKAGWRLRDRRDATRQLRTTHATLDPFRPSSSSSSRRFRPCRACTERVRSRAC